MWLVSARRRLARPVVLSRLLSTVDRSSGPRGLDLKTVPKYALGHNDYLGKVLNAPVYDVAVETPLQPAPILSNELSNTILIKREDLQPVFSFKIRGAYNKISQLTPEQLAKGVVACSAGNHAQGVALSARHLGIEAAIVMPKGTPSIKTEAVRKHGGNVIIHGQTYDEAQAEAIRLRDERGMTLIHPFDDPLVIAGQGTIGAEILKQAIGKPLDAIFVCCGGGGMLAGIAAYVKRVRPEVKVIGVEAADAAGMTASLKAGRQVTLESVGLFADGAAVKTVGAETFRICKELVDDMVTVSTDEICAAIKDGFTETRSILEPAGALAIAGMRRWCIDTGSTGRTLAGIASGANMDFTRLRFVSERSDLSETMLSVLIPEEKGSFRKLISHIEPRNVTEFSYRMGDPERASIYLSFQASGSTLEAREADVCSVVASMRGSGLEVSDLRDNELAKAHLRHLGGGRANVKHEQIVRFEFPERPGALVHFLDSLNAVGWNVSLFQYRNHGADIGRVLAGLTVPTDQLDQVCNVLDGVGFGYTLEDTGNELRQRFL
jgi:threonine dehydratase